MKIVKLTFNYDWPLERQTPNNSMEWEGYRFVIDDELKECDYWVVFGDYNFKDVVIKCPKNNTIFITGECASVQSGFKQHFLDQFGMVLTVQKTIKHKNVFYVHNAHPWFVGKNYDELSLEHKVDKTKLISVISSNKNFTPGHQKRYDFALALKDYFKDKIDLFGRGINDFDDKWDVLAPYKYSIAIENDFCDDWVTEKYFDCIYTKTLPFYYGCPNLETIVDKNSFIRIELNDFEKSIHIIEEAIKNDEYLKREKILTAQKIRSLNNDQFFPFLSYYLDKMDVDTKKKEKKYYKNRTLSLRKKILKFLSV